MHQSLTVKLFFVNFLAILILLSVIAIAIETAGQLSFFEISPDQNESMNVRDSIPLNVLQPYLWLTGLAAAGIVSVLHLVVIRNILKPLRNMLNATREIENGDFSRKIPVTTDDELGRLAASFNRLTENIKKNEDLRRVLIADIGHELRTPLTNIRGYLEGLMEKVILPSQKTFKLIHEETLNLINLVESTIQLAKADHARENIKKVNLLIEPLLKKVMSYFLEEFYQKKITVRTDFMFEDQFVRADARFMIVITRHLLQNALMYTPPYGTIKVATKAEASEIRVTISNTGHRIPQDSLPFIFERFFKVDASRNLEIGGAGIGLAIVKGLVEAHGGRVGAESTDELTTIWFCLPLFPSLS